MLDPVCHFQKSFLGPFLVDYLGNFLILLNCLLPEDDGGVVAGVGGQQLLEESAAGGEQDLVALDGFAVGRGQSRVHELLGNPAKVMKLQG